MNDMERPSDTSHGRALPALARLIDKRTADVDDLSTPIRELTLFRRERIVPPAICLVEPSVVFVAQGAKQLLIGSEAFRYDVEHFLITSVDVPANSEVIDASAQRPCLGLTLKLDLRVMAELIAQGGLASPATRPRTKSVGIGRVTPELLDAIGRLLRALDDPGSVTVLAPLIQREIHFRLLTGDQAPHLWQMASVGSQGQRVSKAIEWLKQHFDQPLRIEDLAARVQMSQPTLHHHFRMLTAMSPLQYQKWLRLNEARRLMLNDGLDAASAAFQVGYESPSQFNREYSRLFGVPPKRDVVELRRLADGGGDGREGLIVCAH